jgi:hypothetical protein
VSAAVSDCPNCGERVDASAELCPGCGFHVRSQHADAVRRLREEGRIRPGRLGAKQRGEFRGGDPGERPTRTELPAEDGATESPRGIDAGL